jgi:RNA polymerase primary sigma factor
MQREQGLEDYFREINRFKLLSRDEEREVIARMNAGDEASRDYLVGCNLRLVVSIARKFVGRGLTFLDLIEEGNLGLIKSTTHFRADEGCRFSTYATWWILQSIKRALVDTAKPVRIPSYLAPKIARWKKTAAMMAASLHRPPSLRELADECEIDEDRYEIFQSAMMSSNSIAQAVSLDGGEDESLAEGLACGKTVRPDDAYFARFDIEELRQRLDEIPAREAEVLRLRFGIGGKEPMTLQEIGDRLKLSRERVRQIEGEALEKLNRLMAATAA